MRLFLLSFFTSLSSLAATPTPVDRTAQYPYVLGLDIFSEDGQLSLSGPYYGYSANENFELGIDLHWEEARRGAKVSRLFEAGPRITGSFAIAPALSTGVVLGMRFTNDGSQSFDVRAPWFRLNLGQAEVGFGLSWRSHGENYEAQALNGTLDLRYRFDLGDKTASN